MMHAVLIAVAGVPLVAQSDDRPTLLEMARQGGGGAVIDTRGPLPSLADRVRPADLIVEGIVRTHPRMCSRSSTARSCLQTNSATCPSPCP